MAKRKKAKKFESMLILIFMLATSVVIGIAVETTTPLWRGSLIALGVFLGLTTISGIISYERHYMKYDDSE